MDLVAQMTGSGVPIAGSVVPTYAANTLVTQTLYTSRYVNINTTSAVGNSTILATNSCVPAGGIVTFQITNDATNARTITWGTGFRSTAVITGTNSKSILVQFVSDGLTLNEVARSASALT